jgi:hypothetical protein
MKISEVKTGDIVCYDIHSKTNSFTVTYKVVEPKEKSVVVEIIQPAYLAGVVTIAGKDFEKFYSK